MITLIYGKSGSGKSLYYERLIEQEHNILYFATLMETAETEEIIERHQSRRSGHWQFRCSTGDIDIDRRKICSAMDDMAWPRYCMIDGLMNWCIYCSYERHDYLEGAIRVAAALTDIVNTYSGDHWFILDNIRTDFYMAPILVEAWDRLHRYLEKNITGLHIFNWEA